MFKDTIGDGKIYVSKNGNVYDLLLGMTSNNKTSDIIFIMYRDKENHINKFVNYVYGGFEHLQEDYIESEIKEFESKMEKGQSYER